MEREPTYADRIRAGEHESKRWVPGSPYSPQQLREIREQARALLHLAASRWLPER